MQSPVDPRRSDLGQGPYFLLFFPFFAFLPFFGMSSTHDAMLHERVLPGSPRYPHAGRTNGAASRKPRDLDGRARNGRISLS